MADKKLYDAVFSEFQKELKQCSAEIFLYPLPFTQVNRLAMLAATVAERVSAQQLAPEINNILELALRCEQAARHLSEGES